MRRVAALLTAIVLHPSNVMKTLADSFGRIIAAEYSLVFVGFELSTSRFLIPSAISLEFELHDARGSTKQPCRSRL